MNLGSSATIVQPQTELPDELKQIITNYEEEKSKTEDLGELWSLEWQYGKTFVKWNKFDKALEWFEYIISESEKDIKPAEVDEYAYRAHQKKAKLLFNILCFKTSMVHLTKAEKLIEASETEIQASSDPK